MGLRRLRGRLDQLQGNANQTMAWAQDLIADVTDGVGITVEVDTVAAAKIFNDILAGKLTGKVQLPLTVKIDPTVDTKGKP
jgi:hypothetical protein